jgi:hypothetical protein
MDERFSVLSSRMRTTILLSGLVAASASSSSVCRGYGSRLSSRLDVIDAATPIPVTGSQPVTQPQAALQTLYSSFVDTALRSFQGSKMLGTAAERPAFASEAEHWLTSFSSASVPHQQREQPEDGVSPAVASLLNGTVSGSTGNSSRSSSLSSTGSSIDANSSSGSDAIGAVAALGGALRSCLGLLHATLMAKIDARPPSFARMPAANQWNGMLLLSGGDRNAALSDRVVANHAAFAARRGYAYWWHRGSLVAPLGWQPYWHKIAMLRRALVRFPTASALIWIDDDIVLTNWGGDDMLRAALGRSNASVLTTGDPASWVALNTGIVLVRNDEGGRETLEEVWRRATAPRADGVSLAFDSQARCLHEQQALEEMLGEPYWRTRIGVLAQRDHEHTPTMAVAAATGTARAVQSAARDDATSEGAAPQLLFNLNTFLRWSHYNAERRSYLRFDTDRHGSGWVKGDFAGHCSGLSSVRRALCTAVLLSSVVR